MPGLDAEQEAFLTEHSRVFLLMTRADGSPTGYPMLRLLADEAIEFSTYRRSAKVANARRDPRLCCVVLPLPDRDETRALVIQGTAEVVEGAIGATSRPPGAAAPVDAPDVPEEVSARAQDRMRSGKRVVLRLTPTSAHFVKA